ncbi:Uncharacterized protein SAPIO_CDS8988 [Scedosporium apiospermum]|uniref:SPT2 chromatin protein n=1 Tax=Pseudallescheria apiosperma TaxID=563466 RepID=A0A084FY42_PSEDA|nr:Uncharacterized protein SAPIO_CDS8988 [Scedosporium apiospermum]KEZ40004.1 Uncharacterized protein SAPIO_CDS8988 [Scedosporium apiospermum]
MASGIGNLLAQITGEKPSSSPARPVPRPFPVPKRKPDEELRRDPAKSLKTGSGNTPASRPLARPSLPMRPDDKPSSSLTRPLNSSRPLDNKASSSSLSRTPSRPDASSSRYNGMAGSRPSSAPAKPVGVTKPASSTTPARPPKKGSFAEIMARAQRAQETMGQVGKIQHKKVEKPSLKKEKDEPKPDPRSAPRKPISGRNAPTSSRPNAVPSSSAPSSRDPRRGSTSTNTAKRKPSVAAAAPEPEPTKKIRRPPTTGYAGTARPRPNAPSTEKKKPTTGGVILNPTMSRYGSDKRRRSSRYEEEDDDMSDFIEYDDDEDEGGMPGRHYYSDDGSSDMEAGMDEIDDEEERAEYLARQDDWREQQLEKRLKLEKEKRKREALDSLRRR